MANLTNRPVYQKAGKARRNDRSRWPAIRALGCILRPLGFTGCEGDTELHHTGTGGGGRKNDAEVIPLCFGHHRGKEGIHTLSRRVWEAKYESERNLLASTAEMVEQRLKNGNS